MSITPATYHFSIWKRGTFSKRLIRLQGTGTSPPLDLTGYHATLTLYSSTDHSTVLMTLNDTTPGGITLGGSAGTIDLLISATTTAALTWRTAVYDLLLTEPDGVTVDALLHGHFAVYGP